MAETNETVTTNANSQTDETQENQTTTESQQDNTDYKALYDAMKADRDKLKGLNDKYSSQIKDYKHKETANLTDSERLKQELEDEQGKTAELEERIAKIQSEKVFADKGFKPEEYNELINVMSEFGRMTEENATKLSTQIIEIINKRVALEKNLYENSLTANNTVQTKETNNSANKTDDFAAFREEARRNAKMQKINL